MFHRSRRRNDVSNGSNKKSERISKSMNEKHQTAQRNGRNGFVESLQLISKNTSRLNYLTNSSSYFEKKDEKNSFENSELKLNATDSDMTDDGDLIENSRKSNWKCALDKKTGKTYYYDTVSKESTWDKPLELSTKAERLKIEREKMKVKSFFHEMERNILNKLSNGEVPGCLHANCSMNEDPSNNSTVIQPYSGSTYEAKCQLSFQEKGMFDSFEGKTIYGLHKEESNSASQIIMHEDARGKKLLQAGVSPDKVTNFPHYVRGSEMHYNGDEFLDEGIEISHDSGGNVVTSHVCRIPERVSVYSASSELGSKMTIKGVCAAYRAHIIESMIQSRNGTCIWSETFNDSCDILSSSSSHCASKSKSPLSNLANSCVEIDSLELAISYKYPDIPSLGKIINFFTEIFTKSQMEDDCIVMSLIYVERLMKKSRNWVRPTVHNWRSLLLMCIIMASKVWDDISMINADFANICSAIRYPMSLKKINELEVSILHRLKFKVNVSMTEYTKYNIFIRSVMMRGELFQYQ